jgi:transcriptional regulator with XRE-family HTH domain
MSFKSWRERILLSQERVAEMSGLSLRTIQRLEAGHRVSYASLRSLAATFEADVDLLERELFAVSKSADEFVEIPRWVRLLTDTFWSGGTRANRLVAQWTETLAVGFAVVLFAASFLITSDTRMFVRTFSFVILLFGHHISVVSRITDTYKLWRVSEDAPPESPPRTWGRLVMEYVYVLGFGVLGIVIVLLTIGHW